MIIIIVYGIAMRKDKCRTFGKNFIREKKEETQQLSVVSNNYVDIDVAMNYNSNCGKLKL